MLPLAASLREQGVLLGAEGVVLLQESVDLLAPTGAVLERARSHFALGRALHLAGRVKPARAELRVAVDLADDCGVEELAEEIRQELAAGPAGLTESERRVAALAAEGKMNREIAAVLFVQLRTVEIHLTKVYRKLGIDGRDQLAPALRLAGIQCFLTCEKRQVRMNLCHLSPTGELVEHESLKMADVRYRDVHQEILRTGHVGERECFRQAQHVCHERVDDLLGVRADLHREHRLDVLPDRARIDLGVIAGDHAAFSQRPVPDHRRGLRDVDAFGQVLVLQPRVLPQLPHDGLVDRIQHGCSPSPPNQPAVLCTTLPRKSPPFGP